MKVRKIVGFILLMAVCGMIFWITGASPANFILVRDFSKSADFTWMPFADICEILQNPNPNLIRINLLGNVLLFAPVGFLLPMIWRGFRRLTRTAAFGVCMSVFIEVNQLFNYRATTTDDVILNTLGAVLGYLCAAAVLRLLPRLSPDDYAERRCVLPAALAALLPYAVLTAQEAWFYLTQW